ncbi:hypothetical protein L596_010702 [Steinernema carpocapsae]|uniref:Uncharacterized protein n=1 Tax=Steinernema carpocapsae TaxID=34508 RepID=A0A4U5PJM7_STECR|nr:hypothetical protein L596_010702 [Steinernema carpocapsae]
MRFWLLLVFTLFIATTSGWFLDSTFEALEKLDKVKLETNGNFDPALVDFLKEQGGRYKVANLDLKVSENERVQFYVLVTPENDEKAKHIIKSFVKQFMEQVENVADFLFGVFLIMAVIIIVLVFVIVILCRRSKNRGNRAFV